MLTAVAGEIALILAMVYSPLLEELFELAPLPLWFWPILAIFGPVVYVLETMRKVVDRRGWLRRGTREEIAEKPV